MKSFLPSLLCVATSLLLGSMTATAGDVSAVNRSPQVEVSGVVLSLNGAGVRQLDSHGVYSAALYLQNKSSDPAVVLQDVGAKSLRVVMLRDVNKDEVKALFTNGLISNVSNDELVDLVSEIFEIGVLISSQGALLAGDSFVIDWSLNTGTRISVQSKLNHAPMEDSFWSPSVARALLSIWLGSQPADAALKTALLGKAA